MKTTAIDEPGLTPRIGEVLNRWPVAGALAASAVALAAGHRRCANRGVAIKDRRT
jgi:hypothetical protein